MGRLRLGDTLENDPAAGGAVLVDGVAEPRSVCERGQLPTSSNGRRWPKTRRNRNAFFTKKWILPVSRQRGSSRVAADRGCRAGIPRCWGYRHSRSASPIRPVLHSLTDLLRDGAAAGMQLPTQAPRHACQGSARGSVCEDSAEPAGVTMPRKSAVRARMSVTSRCSSSGSSN